VACNDYHVASELSFVNRSLDVWDFSPVSKSVKSFADWWVPGSYVGKNATLVYAAKLKPADQDRIAAAFERVDPPEEVRILRAQLWGPKDGERYFLQRAWNYKGIKTVEREKTDEE